MPVVTDVFEPHADSFGDARFLHRDSVQRRRGRHGLFAVSHDHELRPTEKTLQHIDKATDVRLVEWSVNFVKHAKRAGTKLENRHQQRNGRQSLLATTQQRIVKLGLTRRSRDDLNPRFQRVAPNV